MSDRERIQELEARAAGLFETVQKERAARESAERALQVERESANAAWSECVDAQAARLDAERLLAEERQRFEAMTRAAVARAQEDRAARLDAERRLGELQDRADELRRQHDETRGYKQHAEQQRDDAKRRLAEAEDGAAAMRLALLGLCDNADGYDASLVRWAWRLLRGPLADAGHHHDFLDRLRAAEENGRAALKREAGVAILAGQRRYTADRSEWIEVLGTYGAGSGGLLFHVTYPNSSQPNRVTGMSEREIAEKYPLRGEAPERRREEG